MPRSLRPLPLLLLVALALPRPSDAEPADPAARGLDVFVHAPPLAAPLGVLPIDVEAVGFPSVTTPVPLPRATVEAVWSPESLGLVAVAPPGVKVTTDAEGRAHLELPVPDGDEGDLELLVGTRSGPHARTRTVKVHRARALDAELFVPDTQVVPGGAVSAWVTVKSAGTGAPVGGAPVHLALLEGGVPRFEAQLVADAAGNAMVRVPIPRSDEPSWSWTLTARAFGPGTGRSASSQLVLSPREETPGTPTLRAGWTRASVMAGERAELDVVVRDAAGQPVADLPLRFWIGPKGTAPPKDDEAWLAASTRAVTDAAGAFHGHADAPSTVPRAGTTMTLVVKTAVDGHELVREAALRVGTGSASAEVLAEAHDLVPGLSQRILLRVRDGFGKPVSGPFLVEGDGLREEVRTDAAGEAELSWKTPPDLGATRNVGPCAGGVAASVRVRPTADLPGLGPRAEPFALCLPIDREAGGIVRADRSTARPGEAVHVTVVPATPGGEARDRAAQRGPWSVVVESENRLGAVAAWMEDGEKGVDLSLPEGAAGAWKISAALPSTRRGARVLGGTILVPPRILPRLAAKVAGGRAAPGGAVDVEAVLSDERGRPLSGSVAAVMIDARGGGSVAGLERLDTRRALCGALSLDAARCDRAVEGDPSLDLLRRVELARLRRPALGPVIDPGANVGEALRRAFASVLLSLEGAVRDASHSPDLLRDVRRKVGRGWEWNPELMTLVTAAMNEPPETPGGEPLTLADLLTVDRQVTFDNVARRVSRAKLFHVLVAVRAFRHAHQLDADEPSLKNPNAILRRLVRDGALQASDLVDPWGGTLQFTPASGPPIPFLHAVKGYELHAPGPDGALGTGDDVRDPFERVLKSGTPYAEAVMEDRVVDAKYEVEVGDATVQAWQALFANLFGDTIGDSFGAAGLGLSGVGAGGGGSGHGIGLGSIGTIGHGRGTLGIDAGVAFWSPPLRTDARGAVRFHVPLRDLETTWRLSLVGVPDGGTAATTTLDIPVALPLSARVDAGASWVEGDEAAVTVTVRNRAARATSAELLFAASGAATLTEPAPGGEPKSQQVTIPAEGMVVAHVRVRAREPGTARLDVRLRAEGAEDRVTHAWEVRAAAEPTDFTSARFVEGSAELSLTLPPQSIRLTGAPRLVLERGFEQALAGALSSLEPDELTSPRALADALEVASRLRRWALTREGEQGDLAVRARAAARRAVGRLAAYAALDKDRAQTPIARALAHVPGGEVSLLGKASECPDSGRSYDENLELLEAEPAAVNGATRPCWDAFVENTAETVQRIGDAEELARLLLAVVERPHRRELAASLADRLRERVALKPSGAMRLPDPLAQRRSARATVWAALLRAVRLGATKSAADAARLASWIGVQRDAQGGYGSTLATRAVVRALLAEGPAPAEPSRVKIEVAGVAQEVELPAAARREIPLPAGATAVEVRVASGPGVVARFERPVLRLWSHPPSDAEGPIHLEATWPEKPKAGRAGRLRLSVRHTVGRAVTAALAIPLPPGVSLAEPVTGVRQVQGVLTVRRALDASESATVIEVPLRFALAGRFTVPEARARVAFEEMARGVAPARPVIVAE